MFGDDLSESFGIDLRALQLRTSTPQADNVGMINFAIPINEKV